MEVMIRWCNAIALIGLAILLCGCIDVDEQYRVSRDGRADVRIILKVDPQFEALVRADAVNIEEKLRADLPAGMTVESTQRIDGKAAFLIQGQGVDLAVLSARQQPMQVIESSAGFLKKRYAFSASVAETPEFPFPHRLRITLPGTIEQTNGKKVETDTVEFDLTNARSGARFHATSTAFALSILSGGPAAGSKLPAASTSPFNASQDAHSWLLPVSLGSIFLGAALLLVGRVFKRTAKVTSYGTAQSQVVSDAQTRLSDVVQSPARVFCSECGVPQDAARVFCTDCGAKLA